MVITTEYVPTGITADYLLLKKRDKCKKTSVCVLKTLTTTKRDTVVPGAANRLEPGDYPGADADDAVGEEQRRTAFDVRGQQASLRTGEPGSGEIAHYGAGKQLLSPLEQLQQDYSKRLAEWENAFAEWQTMSGVIRKENAALHEHVTSLSRQVQSLSEQLDRL